MTLPTDPRAELRLQRTVLISAIRELEDAFAADGHGLGEFSRVLQLMREHLLLAAFVDRTDTEPAPPMNEFASCTHPHAKADTPWCQRCGAWRAPTDGSWQRSDLALRVPAHDTDRPPADPTLLTCSACGGTGLLPGEHVDVSRVCSDCYGQGCL